jgi:hypothetical protein
VIKHFFTDDQLATLVSGFSGELRIQRFPECRRIIVTFVSTKTNKP